mgnify:CR=1 FL=1
MNPLPAPFKPVCQNALTESIQEESTEASRCSLSDVVQYQWSEDQTTNI